MNPLQPIDDLWDFGDPEGTEAKFREVIQNAEDESFLAEVTTQIARTKSLRRHFDEAHETLDGVAGLLPRVAPRVEVRYLLERGRTWNSSGAKDKAKELFYTAFDMAKQVGDDYLTVDAAHMLAIVEEPQAALEWNLLGFRILEESQQERAKSWIGALSNNIAWSYHDIGEFETALAYFEKGLEYRRSVGKEPMLRIALWAVARCKRSLGRNEEALEEQLAIQRDYFPNVDEIDGYVAEEIAECLLALEKRQEAREYFALAHKQLSADEWLSQNEPGRIARLKELAS